MVEDPGPKAQYFLNNEGGRQVKLCPICGGFLDVKEYSKRVHFVCENCGISGLLHRTVEEAITDWNLMQKS